MSETLRVDPAVLQHAAHGIQSTIDELSGIGFKEAAAEGRGFALLTLSPLQAGKYTVQQGFEQFADRWSWGVRRLVQAGTAIAQALGLAAGKYHMMDEVASNTGKEIWTNLMGNPHLSSDQIDKRSWSQTLADNPVNDDVLHPDYSAASFQQAWQKIKVDGKVVEAVGPQAAANLTAVQNPELAPAAAATGLTPAPGWNTGAAQKAAEIEQSANQGQ